MLAGEVGIPIDIVVRANGKQDEYEDEMGIEQRLYAGSQQL